MKYAFPRWIRALAAGMACAMLVTGILSCSPFEDEETFHPPQGEGPWILVDLYHSRKQNHEDYRLEKGNYNYQGVFGFYRTFEHLENNGYKTRSIRTMPLSEKRLEGFDVLFINLLDDDRPDFSAEERRHIQQWVRDGGGLFVIADHTNVYRHAERLNPLLAPMDIEIGFHTVVEQRPERSVAGGAWVMVFDFARHFLTRGVDMISLQTGGPILSDYGLGFTSEDSYGDYWDEDESTGFYGNWRHDGDEEVEPRGPLPVFAARDYGQGRVAIVGDQNMFGDAWLHFGNNFELVMNIFQWLAGDEDGSLLRTGRPPGLNIGLELIHNEFSVGRKGDDGYYVFFVNFNRDHEVTGRGRMGIDTRYDVLWLVRPDIEFGDDELADVEQFFADGKTVVLSFEADDISPATEKLLLEFAPDFTLETDEQTYRVFEDDEPGLQDLDVERVEGPLALDSQRLPVHDLQVGAHPRDRENPPAGLSMYLLEIASEWGDPLITARTDGGLTVDIARRKAIGDGELIVFVQDGFWRNRTLGGGETTRPTDENEDAVELQYRVLDYLKETSR
ncbi:MAG: DUF4350 domain-containing protein [Persicimonas sp.]